MLSKKKRTDGDVHAYTHAARHTRKTATKAAVGDGKVDGTAQAIMIGPRL